MFIVSRSGGMWIAIARTKQICDRQLAIQSIDTHVQSVRVGNQQRKREKGTVIHHIRLTVLILLTLMNTLRLNTFPACETIDISI